MSLGRSFWISGEESVGNQRCDEGVAVLYRVTYSPTEAKINKRRSYRNDSKLRFTHPVAVN